MASMHSTPSASSRLTITPIHCQDCGLAREDPGWIVARVPDDVWQQIRPRSGLLCINCIARRCAAVGLKDVPVQLEGGPLRAIHASTAEWFLGEYREYLQSEDKSAKTIYNYLIDVRLFGEWLASSGFSTSLLAVDSEVVIAYRSYLQSIGRKPSTINRNLVALRLYFEWLVQMERVLRNPVKAVKRVAQVAPKPRKLTSDEVSRFLKAVEEHGTLQDLTLFITMINTGLRASETCNLRWDALTLARQPHMVEVRGGKGNKYRVVPLNDSTYEALSRYRESLDAKPAKDAPVFPYRDRVMPPRELDRKIKHYAALAGVEDVSAHDFRHYFAYQVVKDTPIHILKELMGHSSIATTAIYTGPTMDDLVRATARLSA